MATIEEKQGGPSQAPNRGPAWAPATNDPEVGYPPVRTAGPETFGAFTGEGWRRMIRRMLATKLNMRTWYGDPS